jgi:hypothetical protein
VKDDELHERLPWITEDGFFDPAKLPIEPVLKQAVSPSLRERRTTDDQPRISNPVNVALPLPNLSAAMPIR